MLNSKFAPIIAGTVLGVLLIGVLGWFFAIKPQAAKMVQYRQEADQVRNNVVTINASRDALVAAEDALKGAEDLNKLLEFNAPSELAMDEFRDRINTVILDSGVQLYGLTQAATQPVDGWLVSPTGLPSTQLAQQFLAGPLPLATRPLPPYTPIVTAPALPEPLLDGLGQIPFTFSVAGTPAEVFKFITLLQDENARLFQVSDVDLTARYAGSAPILGVADAVDGDVVANVVGVLYLLGTPETPDEDGTPAEQQAPAGTPFVRAPEVDVQAGG